MLPASDSAARAILVRLERVFAEVTQWSVAESVQPAAPPVLMSASPFAKDRPINIFVVHRVSPKRTGGMSRITAYLHAVEFASSCQLACCRSNKV